MESSDSALVLFPGALGDFLCAVPAFAALRAAHRGPMQIVARSSALELIDWPNTTVAAIERREISGVFANDTALPSTTARFLGPRSLVHSWTGYGCAGVAEYLRQATGGAVHVHPFRDMRPGEHAVDYYARCVGLAPAALPRPLTRAPTQRQPFPASRPHARLIVIHPGSGSSTKNWEGFPQLIAQWTQRNGDTLVVLLGPGEEDLPAAALSGAMTLRDQSLPEVVDLLHRCDLYLGNDSGIAHLAGCVGARGVVMFGPSDPKTWAPRSDRLRILHAPEPCATCGSERFCVHRLPVATVLDALESQGAQHR